MQASIWSTNVNTGVSPVKTITLEKIQQKQIPSTKNCKNEYCLGWNFLRLRSKVGKNFLVEYSALKVGALRRQAGSPVNCEQAGKLGDSWPSSMTLTRSTMAKYQMAQCSRVRLATWFGELSRSTFIRWTCSIFRRQFWIVDLRLLILTHGPAPAGRCCVPI